MELDKNGSSYLRAVKCYICGNVSRCGSHLYHSSTHHWEYKCQRGHIWWIGEEEIKKNAI